MTDHWNAEDYAQSARFVTDLGAGVVDLLAPQPGERILDLGCGDGPLSLEISQKGASVIGVDASTDMVRMACERGVEAYVVDGHNLQFNQEFDAVFSNAALHWMTQPDAVISGVTRALKPGGRFVAEMGGHGNVAAIRTALITLLAQYSIESDLSDVWYFPSVAEQSARLQAAGFRVECCEIIPRPTPVSAGIKAWLTTLAAPAMAKLPTDVHEEALIALEALLAPALRQADGLWVADYIRLRFKAVLS
ncbi:MAG: methyltransferase domain-containing protein [Pseudomonadota bacterium]